MSRINRNVTTSPLPSSLRQYNKEELQALLCKYEDHANHLNAEIISTEADIEKLKDNIAETNNSLESYVKQARRDKIDRESMSLIIEQYKRNINFFCKTLEHEIAHNVKLNGSLDSLHYVINRIKSKLVQLS